jgi:hypothetical protein
MLYGLHASNINIVRSTVDLSSKIPALGVMLDSTVSFNPHVCKTSDFRITALGLIHPVLTNNMATSMAVGLVQSRLDYANSLLYKTSVNNINKLDRVQNMDARLVLPNRYSHDSLSQLQ